MKKFKNKCSIIAAFLLSGLCFANLPNTTCHAASPKSNGNTKISEIKLQRTQKSTSRVKQIKQLQPPKKSITPRTITKYNNTLTKEEFEYYQKKIGNNYRIVNNKGASGYHATAYDLEDKQGKKFILKISNHPGDKKIWIERQKTAAKKINDYYKNYSGNLRIPNYVKIGDDFVIEENLGRQIGTEDFWQTIPKEEITKFIDDMAAFFIFNHSKAQGKVSPITIDNPRFTLEDAYSYLNKAGALGEDDRKMISNLIRSFKKRDTSDEITCLIHDDIRYENIVYDSETKKFALVDFDALEENGKMYLDFTSRGPTISHIPYDIISKIIDKYNEFSKAKVNKEKVKAIYKLGIFYDIAISCKFKHAHKYESDIWFLSPQIINKFGKRIDTQTICQKVWPFIKQTFKAIDKGFKN